MSCWASPALSAPTGRSPSPSALQGAFLLTRTERRTGARWFQADDHVLESALGTGHIVAAGKFEIVWPRSLAGWDETGSFRHPLTSTRPRRSRTVSLLGACVGSLGTGLNGTRSQRLNRGHLAWAHRVRSSIASPLQIPSPACAHK